jgi:hypothetical protein
MQRDIKRTQAKSVEKCFKGQVIFVPQILDLICRFLKKQSIWFIVKTIL